MMFSLIISTRERTRQLERLLRSLRAQTLQDFEVIVSDQNEDDRLVSLLKGPEWEGRLLHLRKNSRGISQGRNAGVDHARGEILGFPDDDCTYPATLLEDVAAFFSSHPQYGVLTGKSVTDDGRDAAARHARKASVIRRETIHFQCIEFAIFVRRSALGSFRFDEDMGVGASTPWQADEGPDLILRMMEKGATGYYDPRISIGHPRPFSTYNDKALDRSYRYACGRGYFLSKHHYPWSHLAVLTAKSLVGIAVGCVKLNRGMARFFAARLRGTWRGWLYRRPKGGDAVAGDHPDA